MKTTPKDRINELITFLGISKNKFAKQVGTSSAMISKVTTQEINFGVDLAGKIISTFPRISPAWLLTGIGEMMLPETGAEPHLKPHLKPHLPENGSFVGAPPHVGENGPGVALEQEIGDLLWAQQHQPAPQPQSTPEETERQAMLSRVFISGNANDYKLLAQLRANPNYFQKARKLEVLREKFKRDLLKTDPDSIQPALDAQLFSLLLSNVSNLHMRYLNTFADAAYNYQNETGPLSETAVENIFYSEYRETMLKEAAKLQPFAEAMQTANGKLQEILRLFLPFDTSGVVEQFLL